MNEAEYLEAATEDRRHLPDLGMAKMLRCRERFSESRKDGARRMRGGGFVGALCPALTVTVSARAPAFFMERRISNLFGCPEALVW
jgi:hypothetical protein